MRLAALLGAVCHKALLLVLLSLALVGPVLQLSTGAVVTRVVVEAAPSAVAPLPPGGMKLVRKDVWVVLQTLVMALVERVVLVGVVVRVAAALVVRVAE
jgi:hypothetical protein